MRVTWDPHKATANAKKHKVSFEEASGVLADPLAITGADPDHSIDETRWITFGLSNRSRLLAVSHTDDDDTISYYQRRAATRPERRLYEEG